MRPYRLIERKGQLKRLRYSDQHPQGWLMLQGVTSPNGLLLPEYRRLPIFRGKRQYGTPEGYVRAVLALKKGQTVEQNEP